MKCPHCLDSFFSNFHTQFIVIDDHGHLLQDHERNWQIKSTLCASCYKAIIYLESVAIVGEELTTIEARQVYPKGVARTPLPLAVPKKYATDYREACLVLSDSPKASAALSRRCLQHILSNEAGVKGDLADQIQKVVDSKSLPSHLAGAIDGVRNLGNFAAHPIKSKNTGEIVEVEAGEAEWLLDTLEGLFDFYLIQPAILKQKQEDLNKKLKDAGKPPMKL